MFETDEKVTIPISKDERHIKLYFRLIFEDEKMVISLEKKEALILFDFLQKFNKKKREPKKKAELLRKMEADLEKQLTAKNL